MATYQFLFCINSYWKNNGNQAHDSQSSTLSSGRVGQTMMRSVLFFCRQEAQLKFFSQSRFQLYFNLQGLWLWSHISFLTDASRSNTITPLIVTKFFCVILNCLLATVYLCTCIFQMWSTNKDRFSTSLAKNSFVKFVI